MTTSSLVTGWVWDLSCSRRSLCSTAAFRERRLGTFFSSNDFSISWDQKRGGILMTERKGNWGSKMSPLHSPSDTLVIRSGHVRCSCWCSRQLRRTRPRTWGEPRWASARWAAEGREPDAARSSGRTDSFYSNTLAHLTLKSSLLAATLSLARSSTFSSSVKSHEINTEHH